MNKTSRFLAWVVGLFAAVAVVETAGWLALPSWSIAASGVSRATPQQVWSWYADTQHWPDWDHLVDQVQSDGPFVTGSIGKSISGGMSVTTELTDVRENRGYTEVMHLPLATLIATHELVPTTAGTRIEHGIKIKGPGAWIIYLLKRRNLQEGMNDAMQRLAARAADGPAFAACRKEQT